MNPRIFLLAMLSGVSFPIVRAQIGAPLFEETFNESRSGLRLANGASLGGPGTGVSGKLADRAYISTPRSTEQEPGGPAALAVEPVAPRSMSAFTCVFWYFLEENTPDLQVIADTAGVSILMHRKGFEVRVASSQEGVRQHQFLPGVRGPLLDWTTPGRWIFAAFTWEQAENALTIQQGTPARPAVFMRKMTRPVPTTPTWPRDNLDRLPETLGNTYTKQDRPLAGRLDNFRFFDRVINQAELEQIRQADLENKPLAPR